MAALRVPVFPAELSLCRMNGYVRTLNDWLALLPRVVRWRWRWYMGIPKLLVKVITNSRSVVGWWEMLCYTSTWMACKSFRVEIPGDFLLRFVPFTTAARPLYNHQCYIKLGVQLFDPTQLPIHCSWAGVPIPPSARQWICLPDFLPHSAENAVLLPSPIFGRILCKSGLVVWSEVECEEEGIRSSGLHAASPPVKLLKVNGSPLESINHNPQFSPSIKGYLARKGALH